MQRKHKPATVTLYHERPKEKNNSGEINKEKAVDVVVVWMNKPHLVPTAVSWHLSGQRSISSIRRPGAADRSVTGDYCPVCLFGLRL